MTIENNNTCKLVFYYGNRCPNSMKDVTASVADNEGYKVQMRPLEPFEVPPKKQIQHYFLVHCFRPFKFPIIVKLLFNYLNKSVTLTKQLTSMLCYAIATYIHVYTYMSECWLVDVCMYVCYDRQHTLSLKLPLMISSFTVPCPLESTAFVGAWQKYGNEVIAMRKLEGVTVAQLTTAVTNGYRNSFIALIISYHLISNCIA